MRPVVPCGRLNSPPKLASLPAGTFYLIHGENNCIYDLRILRWGDYPGSFVSVKCSNKHLYKRQGKIFTIEKAYWNDAANKPRNASSPQRLEEQGADPPIEPLECCVDTLISVQW